MKKYDSKKAKLTRMENFLHNYMNKLERLLRPLKDKHITNRYKRLAEEYFRRLSQDTIDKPSGFQMGDMTMELLDLSNYVLDTVDISEMKKAGVLKTFLLNQVQKSKPNKEENLQKPQNTLMNKSPSDDDDWGDSSSEYS